MTGEDKVLRFGIMCDGTELHAWQARCVDELLATAGVEPALLIINRRPDTSPSAGLLRKATNFLRGRSSLWSAVWKYWLSRRSLALAPVDMSGALSAVPKIHCQASRMDKLAGHFGDGDVESIREYRLDFILRFSPGIVRGNILTAARYGIWSYHHGDLDKYRGGPPCFWELYRGEDVIGVTLQRLTERLDGGIVLHKGHIAAIKESLVRSFDALFLESSYFPARVCREIREGVATCLDSSPSETVVPVTRTPGAFQVARWAARTLRHRVLDKWDWLFRHDQWNVGVVEQPIHTLLANGEDPSIRWLASCPRGRSIADPFGIDRDGSVAMLVEDYDQRLKKGRIAAFTVESGKAALPAKAVLEVAGHISYPYLFKHGGEVYCTPETADARTVTLFRATDFPSKWERVGTLVEGAPILDPTVFEYGGRWWLFGARTGIGESLKLYAWYATSPTGHWAPHACNPLKMDVRSSRPAGTPFTHRGELHRPSQDCSQTYGGGLSVNRIVQLTPAEFEEEVVAVLKPRENSPYSAGFHTISAVGNITLVDGKRRLLVPAALWHAVRSSLGKIMRQRQRVRA